MADKEEAEKTISEDLVVTKYKMAGDIVNREFLIRWYISYVTLLRNDTTLFYIDKNKRFMHTSIWNVNASQFHIAMWTLGLLTCKRLCIYVLFVCGHIFKLQCNTYILGPAMNIISFQWWNNIFLRTFLSKARKHLCFACPDFIKMFVHLWFVNLDL